MFVCVCMSAKTLDGVETCFSSCCGVPLPAGMGDPVQSVLCCDILCLGIQILSITVTVVFSEDLLHVAGYDTHFCHRVSLILLTGYIWLHCSTWNQKYILKQGYLRMLMQTSLCSIIGTLFWSTGPCLWASVRPTVKSALSCCLCVFCVSGSECIHLWVGFRKRKGGE